MTHLSNSKREIKSSSQKVSPIFPEVRDTRLFQERPVLITGGAGFVGTNLAHRLLSMGKSVLLFDNLSRPGVEQNVEWIRALHGARAQLQIGDIRNRTAFRKAVHQVSQIYHLAAQVAVTTSLTQPVFDFEVNVLGTLNILEEMREHENPPSLVFTSTNKVYGSLSDVALRLAGSRYEPLDPSVSFNGISETRPLDFHSPYGCSKGAADQYVIDYARTYRLPTVVFRMSCVYGPHQFGTEDQGWVAHFLIKAMNNQPITLYGDGMQVRDVLFVEDLVDAFLLAQANMSSISGEAFNIGGGPANTVSLLELLGLIKEVRGTKPKVSFEGWRMGDQRYYVSDTGKFQKATGWEPKVDVRKGLERLHEWLIESREVSKASYDQVLTRQAESL